MKNSARNAGILIPLILLSAFVLLLQGQGAASPATLITGGKGVGPVSLGQPVSRYEKFLGRAVMKSPVFYDYPARKMALLVKNGVIEGIMVYSPSYRTSSGVAVGMPLSVLEKRYGSYLRTDAGSLVYNDLGLAFNEKDSKISTIMVVAATKDPLLGDGVLVPGVRAGGIKIGMEMSAVEKYWGSPTSTNPLESSQKITVSRYDQKAVKLLISDGLVAGVQINSFKYKTPEGIGVNSTKEQVIKTYGSRFREVNNSLMYNSLGLGFYINEGKVMEILLTYRKE